MGVTRSIDLECDQRQNKLSELVVGVDMTALIATVLPGGHSEWEPPDPFSNSEVKTLCADASVGFVNVKVGHCQALNLMPFMGRRNGSPSSAKADEGFFVFGICVLLHSRQFPSVRAELPFI
jgi:hypothetical protein